jgi:hypothetical protein
MKRNPVGVPLAWGACRTIACLSLAGLVSIGQETADRESLSDWKLVRTLQLEGKTFHVQGVDADGEHVWVTSCDRAGHKAFLHRFSMASGVLEQAVDITDGVRYHPGGIDSDATSIWVPVAEYRASSTAVIERRDKRTLQIQFRFAVPDHIGCVAITPELIIGGNWDSRNFYVWNHRGELLRTVANKSGNNYQDMKFVPPHLIASGVYPGSAGGAIDWLDLPGFQLARRISAGNNDRGVPYTREGMSFRGNRILLLPEDGPSRLFVFERVP